MKRLQLICFLALAALTACRPTSQPVKIRGEAQGTYYSIIYYDSQHRNLQPQIDSLLHHFDLTASLWEEGSVIRRINSGQDSVVNDMFADLFQRSLQINQYTQGAFNCKIGALVNLYGFGFKNREDVTRGQLDSLLLAIGSDRSRIEGSDPRYLSGKAQGVEFDFNAIAQGYSVDLLAAMFDSLGIGSYLIDVGGEVIAKGLKPNGDNWVVGIERPAENKYDEQEVETAIRLCDQSVVTSGNYRKYYEQDGIRYSHTINPATGRPVEHTLLSVSVVSRESWYADAMATAFMVMGLDQSLQFIQQHPDDPDIQAVFFIYDQGGEYHTFATPQFQQLIKE
ncbi:MAG: FAD:protein FMN transferase [Bacteroidales bacterium]|nr:FAD:protein FMN transferase [Bacteroidales bacterium]